MSLSTALKALEPYKQFILWQKVPGENGKTDKLPVNAAGEVASAHDPAIWMYHHEAESLASVYGLYVGFVLTHHDPFFFVDIDSCVTPDGQWTPRACDLMSRFNGAAIEVSQSGRGLHIIGQATVTDERRKKAPDKTFDLYTNGRFIALTDLNTIGDAGFNHQAAAEKLVNDFLLKPEVTSSEWTTEKHPECTAPDDDNELLALIRTSKTAKDIFDVSGMSKFEALWSANHDYLIANYPHDQKPDEFDHSEADAALCAILGFWTGGDCSRIDRLFRQSALYRPKWERANYREDTVTGAVAKCKNFYTGGRKPPVELNQELAQVRGYKTRDYLLQYMNCEEQMVHFLGCTYIVSDNKVLTPTGKMLKPENFKGLYGGHNFALDSASEKNTTNAFEAFTQNQGYECPKADSVCFRPELPSNAIIEEGGLTMVNCYYPIVTPRLAGDVGPFIDLVARLLPDVTDQHILIAYMASLVQNPGVKFQYTILLQGTEGNGKSTMIRVLRYCVGKRYSFEPNARQLDKNFNSWLANRLFIGVEEIKVGHSRLDVLEALKPMITNEVIEIEGKGVDQDMGDNYGNFFMCSNYKDAIPVTVDTRRYCILYCLQQHKTDKARDGLTPGYFKHLYQWLKDENGYAIVNDFLMNYQIPVEYDPATGMDAPRTTSSDEAVTMSMGPVEQEIQLAIDEGRQGFKFGWISSVALTSLMQGLGRRHISPHKRKEMLEMLGYVPHPTLNKGCVNTPSVAQCDMNRRPILYCNSEMLGATAHMGASEIKIYYEQCQIA